MPCPSASFLTMLDGRTIHVLLAMNSCFLFNTQLNQHGTGGMSRLTLIVAATKTNGIGQKSRLPWRLSKEMAYFKRITCNAPEGRINAVLMGRKTWESIPAKFKPLPNRVNIVISRNTDYQLYVETDSFDGQDVEYNLSGYPRDRVHLRRHLSALPLTCTLR